MRIAFFADSYKPYLSGVTNSAETLVNELRRLGHRVFIFAPHYPGHQDTDPDIFRLPSLPGGYPKFRLALPWVKQVPEVELIHSHSPFQAGLLAQLVARRRKLPLVYSFHTLFTRYVHFAKFVPPALAKAGIVGYLKAYCRGADSIIAPSKLARRVLRTWGIGQPVEVIPSGIELHKLSAEPTKTRAALRQKFGLQPTDKVLLYAGRLSKEKNIPFLLEAFDRLSTLRLTADDLRLVLVGGGPLFDELRIANYELRKRIILTGEIPYPEVLNYYFMGDIFVFASLTETQGLVLAEAKAAGLPVVALFAGGLTGTVRSGLDGYLTSRDPDAFARHVARLSEDDALRRRMSLAAREDARERFSSAVIAKQVETVYNSLIHQGRKTNVQSF